MAACGGSDVDGPDPDPGIPLALAEERSARLSNVRYDLRFTIPESAAEPITGTAAIRFALKDTERPVVLDFAPGADHLTSVTVGGRAATYRAVNGHIVIAPRALAAGENVVQIDFRAGDIGAQPQPRLPVLPLRAGTGAPDVPVLRPARHQGAIHAGADRPCRMGGDFERRRNRARNRRRPVDGAIRRDAADSDVPLRVRGRPVPGRDGHERNGRTFRIFHRETDQAKVARNRDAAFDLHASALQWLEDYTAHPVSSSASSISSSSRRSSSAAWNTRGPSTTTPRRSFSTSRRPRTRCSAAPASSRTKRRTCGSAIW